MFERWRARRRQRELAKLRAKRPKPKPKPPEVEADPTLTLEARNIVHRHVYAAMTTSILPFPLVDIAGLSVVQLSLIRRLAEHYGRPYNERLARRLLLTLLTGSGGIGMGRAVAASVWKSVPVVGHALAGVSAPVIAGSLTYALGQTFVMHFGLGGTLLDFDPDRVQDHFRQEFGAAQAQHAQRAEADEGEDPAELAPASSTA